MPNRSCIRAQFSSQDVGEASEIGRCDCRTGLNEIFIISKTNLYKNLASSRNRPYSFSPGVFLPAMNVTLAIFPLLTS